MKEKKIGDSKMEKRKKKLEINELNAILERYVPTELLPQVKESVQALFHRSESAELWKFRDRMTGMYNTQGILQILEDWKAQCLQTQEHMAILCIDVDKLENINQIYGHSEGDVVIQTFGQILEDCVTEHETCGHLGSSEFVVIMRTAEKVGPLAESFLHALGGRIDNFNRVSGKEYSLHIIHSMYAVELSSETVMPDILDQALAQKRLLREGTRNLGGSSSPKESFSADEHRQVNELIDKNLFRYAFQPIVNAKTGDIYAYEALMRAGEGIPFSPLVILKYADLDNRLHEVERATFFNVLELIRGFGDIGDRKFFINSISNSQLTDEDYEKLKAAYGDLFPNMVVEITEQTELEDELLDMILNRSRKDGFGLAIDDYGTGYSNTSSLLRYLPNCVKLDRLLITDIQENPKKQHFVNNIITFAHDNGFLALAEGVETSAEMKAVIHMGVDLIQGFYTAKPEFTPLKELPENIRNEIIKDNMSIHENVQRKIYIVNNESELPLIQLALEKYTGIVVSQPELTLVGSLDYPAAMSIKIKDACRCKLTLKNVSMESIDDLPCIDIGNDAHLTLILEGNNVLDKTGIRVPDGSSCCLKGAGNLSVFAKGIQCYGIGNDYISGVGEITCAQSGKLEISTEGNHCINIGGGIYRQGDGIQILSGSVLLKAASESAIGIGCGKGSVPVKVQNCFVGIDFRVATGCALGSWEGDLNVHIADLKLEIAGSGAHLSGIGSVEKAAGEIRIERANVSVQMNGQQVRLIGNGGCGLKIAVSRSSLSLKGEGNNVLGIGCFDRSAVLESKDSVLEIRVQAAENEAVGAREENCTFEGGTRTVRINE